MQKCFNQVQCKISRVLLLRLMCVLRLHDICCEKVCLLQSHVLGPIFRLEVENICGTTKAHMKEQCAVDNGHNKAAETFCPVSSLSFYEQEPSRNSYLKTKFCFSLLSTLRCHLPFRLPFIFEWMV